MDSTFTPAQLDTQATARAFAHDVLRPAAEKLDRDGGFPEAALAQAAQRGLLGVGVPTELGGRGAGAVAYALAVMEMAHACASTTVAICVSNMVAEVLTAFGTPKQRGTWVPALCTGACNVGAFALSEPGAGSDPAGMRTKATRTGDGYVLAGSKLWITSGTHAGVFIVWARTSDAPGARGLSAFVVPAGTPGLEVGRAESKLGLHGSSTVPLTFTDCLVGHDALLGEEGHGFRIAMMALDGGRIGIASQACGVGQAALDTAAPLLEATSQHATFTFADGATHMAAARLLALAAATRKDAGVAFSTQAAMAKLFASERAFETCTQMVTLARACEGATVQTRALLRYLRDVRVAMIYEGTSEIQRVVLSREIARHPEGVRA